MGTIIAHAAGESSAQAQAGSGSQWLSILMLVGIVVLMYLVVFLPSKRREKKAREMIDALTVGDMVTTIGGIDGTIVNIKDDDITIETSIEKSKIQVKKWAIKEVHQVVTEEDN